MLPTDIPKGDNELIRFTRLTGSGSGLVDCRVWRLGPEPGEMRPTVCGIVLAMNTPEDAKPLLDGFLALVLLYGICPTGDEIIVFYDRNDGGPLQ